LARATYACVELHTTFASLGRDGRCDMTPLQFVEKIDLQDIEFVQLRLDLNV
jgi:hypothetical protein